MGITGVQDGDNGRIWYFCVVSVDSCRINYRDMEKQVMVTMAIETYQHLQMCEITYQKLIDDRVKFEESTRASLQKEYDEKRVELLDGIKGVEEGTHVVVFLCEINNTSRSIPGPINQYLYKIMKKEDVNYLTKLVKQIVKW